MKLRCMICAAMVLLLAPVSSGQLFDPNREFPTIEELKELGLSGETSPAYLDFRGFHLSTHNSGQVPDEQGWKLHVSADPEKPGKIMIPVLNKLAEMDVSHKFKHPSKYKDMLRARPEQQGKFITIYPESLDKLKQVAEELSKIVPRDERFYDNTLNDLKLLGPITARYGKFTGNDRLWAPKGWSPGSRVLYNPGFYKWDEKEKRWHVNDDELRKTHQAYPAWEEEKASSLSFWGKRKEFMWERATGNKLHEWYKLLTTKEVGPREVKKLNELEQDLTRRGRPPSPDRILSMLEATLEDIGPRDLKQLVELDLKRPGEASEAESETRGTEEGLKLVEGRSRRPRPPHGRQVASELVSSHHAADPLTETSHGEERRPSRGGKEKDRDRLSDEAME